MAVFIKNASELQLLSTTPRTKYQPNLAAFEKELPSISNCTLARRKSIVAIAANIENRGDNLPGHSFVINHNSYTSNIGPSGIPM